MNHTRFAFSFLSLTLFGCSPSSACVDGISIACACATGAVGAQVCASGAYGACVCTSPGIDAAVPVLDASPGADTGADAPSPTVDAWSAATDGGTSSCPAPFVQCATGCIDPREDRDHCGATDACTDTHAGESCSGWCFMGRCVWDDCSSALAAGHTTSGVYAIDSDGSGPVVPADGYCDMTTAGGGWTLVYAIRNDIPNISDPFWGMVDLGAGSALPASPAPLAAGTHFEGPTRDVRAPLSTRLAGGAGLPEMRATMISPTGATLFDIVTPASAGIRVVATGLPDPPQSYFAGGLVQIVGTSTGFPAVGATGGEGYSTCSTGTCDDYDYWGNGSIQAPIFGDSTVSTLVPQAANSTTLFWVRPHSM